MTDKPDQSFRDGLRWAATLALRRSLTMQMGSIPNEDGVHALQDWSEYLAWLSNKERLDPT